MSEPRRIQLSRRAGWRMPANTVKVARPSRWGNMFTVEVCGSRAKAVEMFACEAGYLQFSDGDRYDAWIAPLRGRNLACWCPLDGEPCHADVLLELANAPEASK